MKYEGFPPTEYCIVGAGPAGVQLGHFFLQENRSYRVFEKNTKAGSFFAEDGRRLPIHRKLISINKRTTGSKDPEFNMRFDWNSLLGDHVPRVTARTRQLWPNAQVIAEYIHDFAGVQIAAGKMAFSTEVHNISKSEAQFKLETSKGPTTCQVVIVASGLQSPNLMPQGENLVHGYESLDNDMEKFEGKEVLVLGAGNAAFETAEALQDFARVAIMHRTRPLPWQTKSRTMHGQKETQSKSEKAYGTRFAMMTHYVGDVRAARLGIFDSYQLKMTDRSIYVGETDDIVIIRCMGNRRCAFTAEKEKKKEEKDPSLSLRVQLNPEMKNLTKVALRKYVKEHPGVKTKDFQFHSELDEMKRVTKPKKSWKVDTYYGDVPSSRFDNEAYIMQVRKRVLEKDPDFFPFLLKETNLSVFRLENSAPAPIVVDDVIRCYGWKMDKSIFDPATAKLKTAAKGKYPVIHDTYEAKGVSGLFFAGTLAHSLDFKKSAGGFIHGFRYSARALFRYLEETRAGVPWPSQQFDLRSEEGIKRLVDHFLYRFNVAAGPYQMFGGTLLDGVIFSKTSSSAACEVSKSEGTCSGGDARKMPGLLATFYEEMPPAYLKEKFFRNFRLIWFFEYGKGFHGPEILHSNNVGAERPMYAQDSTFLHPRMQLLTPGSNKAASGLQHWVLEELTFSFSRYYDHEAPLTKYIKETIHYVSNVTDKLEDFDG